MMRVLSSLPPLYPSPSQLRAPRRIWTCTSGRRKASRSGPTDWSERSGRARIADAWRRKGCAGPCFSLGAWMKLCVPVCARYAETEGWRSGLRRGGHVGPWYPPFSRAASSSRCHAALHRERMRHERAARQKLWRRIRVQTVIIL